MMSIGTLFAYTLVSASVLILRYRASEDADVAAGHAHEGGEGEAGEGGSSTPLISGGGCDVARTALCNQVVVYSNTRVSVCGRKSSVVGVAVTALTVFVIGVCVACVASVILTVDTHLPSGGPGALSLWGTLVAGLCVSLGAGVLLHVLPAPTPVLTFVCPLFPALPLLSVAINCYLLANLSPMTWVRFGAWLLICGVVYFTYSIRHSKAGSAEPASHREVEEEEENEGAPMLGKGSKR